MQTEVDIKALKQKLAHLERLFPQGAGRYFTLGRPDIDAALGGGLVLGAVHEIFAAQAADAAAAAGFGLALALRAAAAKPLVWVRQDFISCEEGSLYAPGLAALGLDPGRLILVCIKDARDGLRAGAEAVRCGAVGAVLLELAGAPKGLDLTVTRRLSLAAEQSGLPLFLIRQSAVPAPSAAMTRWHVAAAPSTPLAANAPGYPVFDITLLRHRAGIASRSWCVEWNHDRQTFAESAPPLSRAVVSLPGERPAAAA